MTYKRHWQYLKISKAFAYATNLGVLALYSPTVARNIASRCKVEEKLAKIRFVSDANEKQLDALEQYAFARVPESPLLPPSEVLVLILDWIYNRLAQGEELTAILDDLRIDS